MEDKLQRPNKSNLKNAIGKLILKGRNDKSEHS